jgi:hypothetical protein
VAIELPAARRPVATFAITVLAAAPPAAALAAAALATAAATGAALRADDLALELARRQGAWRASAATTTPAAGRRRRLACVAALGRLGGCSGDTVTGAQVRQAHTAGGWESDTVSCQVHTKQRKEALEARTLLPSRRLGCLNLRCRSLGRGRDAVLVKKSKRVAHLFGPNYQLATPELSAEAASACWPA